jgi:hypothetical protein
MLTLITVGFAQIRPSCFWITSQKKLKDINKEDTKQTTERKTEENSDAL